MLLVISLRIKHSHSEKNNAERLQLFSRSNLNPFLGGGVGPKLTSRLCFSWFQENRLKLWAIWKRGKMLNETVDLRHYYINHDNVIYCIVLYCRDKADPSIPGGYTPRKRSHYTLFLVLHDWVMTWTPGISRIPLPPEEKILFYRNPSY